MKQKLLLASLLFSQLFFGQWTQIGSDIDSNGKDDFSGKSIAINDLGDIIAVAAPDDDESEFSFNNGIITVYKKNESDQWEVYGNKIIGEATNDLSGFSLSMDGTGNVVAIGSIDNDGVGVNAGHVRIYEYVSGTWTQKGADIDGEAADDLLGTSVSLNNNGTIVAVGAPNNDGGGADAGHVRIYEYIAGTWTQKGTDIDGEAAGDLSGTSVSLNNSGTIVAIGAPNNDGIGTDAGHVRIYEYTGGMWTQKGADIEGETAGDLSGTSVSLNNDGTNLVIGSTDSNGLAGLDTGHASIYKYESSSWSQVGTKIEGEGSFDQAGNAVDISDDGLIIALASRRNGIAAAKHGHVRIYKNISNSWIQVGDDIDGEASEDYSGWSVGLNANGTIIAIGAPLNDGLADKAGHARVYKYNEIVLNHEKTIINGLTISYINNVFESNLSNIKLEIHNILGQTIPNKNIESGIYFVKAHDDLGAFQLFKIYVK